MTYVSDYAARGEMQRSADRDTRGVPSPVRRRLLFAIKLAVTLTLCGWIVAHVDWTQFWSIVRGSVFWIIGVVVLMRLGGVVISAFKWQQLLAIHDVRYNLGRLIRWYFVALFFNHFLPTSIGGDGYRIYKTFDNPRGKACAVLSVFVERITGLAALVTLGYASAIVLYLRDADSVAGTVVALVSAGFALGILGTWVTYRFSLVDKISATRFWPKPMNTLLSLASDFRRQPGRSALVGLISFIFHVNKICVIWLLLLALGTQVNILTLTVAVVAVELIGLLPITLGGFGLVEGSFIYTMGHYGVNGEVALATMLMMRVLMVPFAMVGAYFYFAGERPQKSVSSAGERSRRGRVPGHTGQDFNRSHRALCAKPGEPADRQRRPTWRKCVAVVRQAALDTPGSPRLGLRPPPIDFRRGGGQLPGDR